MARQLDDTGGEPGWGLFVNEPRRDLAQRKSIKVKLPIRQHIKLHALKLFSENNISETVEAALDLYFEQMRQSELASRLAAGEDVASAADAGGDGQGNTGGAGAGGVGSAVTGLGSSAGFPGAPRNPGS